MVKVVTDKNNNGPQEPSRMSRASGGEVQKKVCGSLLTTSFGMASLKTRMDVEISCGGKQKPKADTSRLNAY
jgi:hypothetical protein